MNKHDTPYSGTMSRTENGVSVTTVDPASRVGDSEDFAAGDTERTTPTRNRLQTKGPTGDARLDVAELAT